MTTRTQSFEMLCTKSRFPMQHKFILILLLLNAVSCTPKEPEIIGEGTSQLNNGKIVNCFFLDSEKSLDPIYDNLEKSFGQPRIDSNYVLYKIYKPDWFRDTITIRIEEVSLIDTNQKQINQMFISAESKTLMDILKPEMKTNRLIKKFFHNLYKKSFGPIRTT